MNRRGHLAELSATPENILRAFGGYARGKMNRKAVRDFSTEIFGMVDQMIDEMLHCTHVTSPYIPKEVFKPKYRIVHKTAIRDHVMQWASVLPFEVWLMDTFHHRSPSCVPGKGTHFYLRQEQNELRNTPQEEVYYTVQLDVHHYFEHIDHELMKCRIREKIKDPVLLHFLNEFVDSFPDGLVLGVKLSQMLSGLYLAPFDRWAIRCFGLQDNPTLFRKWQAEYVSDCLVTCRTKAQSDELAKGVGHLNAKFARYVEEGLKHYSRFADNIVIKHRDKAFLHIIVRMAIDTLREDYKLEVNKSWNVRPTWMGNDICGYVLYHDHTMLRKRNKKALCRQVARLRKKGKSDSQIRLLCSSRAGFAQHCNSRHLLTTLKMEKRLGAVIKNRKKKAPFEGMTPEQKKSIEEVIMYANETDENAKLIQLIDFKVDDSVIEKNEDGTPKQRIAIRYRIIDHVENPGTDDAKNVWKPEEWYSFSGSRVMIEQALQDFSREDLPLPTVIKEYINKQRKKFYKFT